MNLKIIVLLISITMIILFATSCTEKTQTEDSAQMQEELQNSTEEQSEGMDPDDLSENQDQNATSQGKISKGENDELLNDTLNTLNDLEETIDSLEDVTDSDLQIPE